MKDFIIRYCNVNNNTVPFRNLPMNDEPIITTFLPLAFSDIVLASFIVRNKQTFFSSFPSIGSDLGLKSNNKTEDDCLSLCITSS